MGLTLPEDYCVHCHLETLENRESHKDLAFDTCASAGCHNFHDNRALYEDFLLNNANQPWLSQITKLNAANHAHYKAERKQELAPAPELASDHPQIMASWSQSAHATAQIGCVDCHTSAANDDWIEKPGIESCQSCHENEVNGFTAGKHGMRLSAALSKPLSPMTPSLARLPFHADAMNKELSCNSCHDVHSVETQTAAVDSCLTCHADDHSMAFLDSPHGKLWQDELAGTGEEGSGVSCATCHMPRMQAKGFIDKEKGIREISVEHNQNATLRPNEKMIRPICMQCHSLEFSIDALADKALIKNNFNGKPAAHIESIDWVLQRVDE